MTRRLLVGFAAAGALLGGAIAFRPGVSLAAAFGGGSAVLWSMSASRIEGAATTLRCNGNCRVFTAELDDSRDCPLLLAPQASYAACLTALNAACTTSCKTNP